MQRVIRLLMLFCCGVGQSALAMDKSAVHVDTDFDPLALYGPSVSYDILRNGALIGLHRIDFKRDGNILTVESQSEIKIKLLFLTAYNFSYVSRSRWQDGKLQSLEATTDDDGDRSVVSIVQGEHGLVATGPSGEFAVPPTQALSEHWWQRFISGDRQFNTITGAINRINVELVGNDYMATATDNMRAARYRIEGDMRLETWYDDAGRWLGMRFTARDKSPIEYRCRTCGADVVSLVGDGQ